MKMLRFFVVDIFRKNLEKTLHKKISKSQNQHFFPWQKYFWSKFQGNFILSIPSSLKLIFVILEDSRSDNLYSVLDYIFSDFKIFRFSTKCILHYKISDFQLSAFCIIFCSPRLFTLTNLKNQMIFWKISKKFKKIHFLYFLKWNPLK